jgi:multicomponent Na+:H+ antiporter subunit E
MLHAFGIFILLYAFWLLLSGYLVAFLLASGAGCALAAVLFSRHMGIIDREGHPLHLGGYAFLTYWPWLIKEIIISAWDVSRRILHPRLPISPTLGRFKPSQQSDLGLVIHANSITLTPGTIAIEVSRDEFLVHALTRNGAVTLAGSEMDRRISALESGK